MKRRESFKRLVIGITGLIFAPNIIIEVIRKELNSLKKDKSLEVFVPYPMYANPNDVLITTLLYNGDNPFNTPSGWTKLNEGHIKHKTNDEWIDLSEDDEDDEDIPNISVYWKRADRVESQSVTFVAHSKGDFIGGRMYAYSNVKSVEYGQNNNNNNRV